MESLKEISKGCPTLLEPEYAQNNNMHCERYPHLLVSYSVGTPKWAIKDTDKARRAICGMGKPMQSMLCVTSAKVYQDTELAALGIHDHETIVYIICSSCGYTISAG